MDPPSLPRRGRSTAAKKSETPEARSDPEDRNVMTIQDVGPISSYKADIESLPKKLYATHVRSKLDNNLVQFVAPDAVSTPKTAEDFQKALQAFEYKNPLLMTFKDKKDAEYWASKHGDFGFVWEISTKDLAAGSVYENPLNPSQILFVNHIPSSNILGNPFDQTKYTILPDPVDEDEDAGGDCPGYVSDSSDGRKPAPKARKKKSSASPLQPRDSPKNSRRRSRKVPSSAPVEDAKSMREASKSLQKTSEHLSDAPGRRKEISTNGNDNSGVSNSQKKKQVPKASDMNGRDDEVTTLKSFRKGAASSVEGFVAISMCGDRGSFVDSMNQPAPKVTPRTPLPEGAKNYGPRMHVFGARKGQASQGTSNKRQLPEGS